MTIENEQGHVLFRAGRGEWYNQPHDEVWDMGEDAASIPPAAWHLEAERAVDTAALAGAIVVDVTEMNWLVGQDWGFLVRLSRRLRERSARLAVVGSPRVVRAGQTIHMDEHFGLATTVRGALEG